MSRPGTCELGCGGERRLDLMPAQAVDELVAAADAAQARVQELRALVRPLTAEAPADAESAYRGLQDAARTGLRALLRRAATVTPHTGQWERGWATLAAAARSSGDAPH